MNPNKLLHNRFLPISSPEYIQLDTNNTCNLKCIYCNVQGEYNLEKGNMKLSIAENFFKELKDIGWNKTIREFRPFVNGDPIMLSPNTFNNFLSLGRKYLNGSKNTIYTNGANSSKAKMFLTPLLDIIHLTISASSPETYEKIHGVPLFDEALKTYNMLIDSDKTIYVHFVYNVLNEKDLDNWKKIFSKANLMISPLHYTDEEINSLNVLDSKSLNRSYEIGTTNNAEILYFWHPCNCYNNMCVSWMGEYMQCPNLHYKYNYGLVGETPIKTYWKNRANDKLNCKGCRNCNLKNKRVNMLTYITSKWVKMF